MDFVAPSTNQSAMEKEMRTLKRENSTLVRENSALANALKAGVSNGIDEEDDKSDGAPEGSDEEAKSAASPSAANEGSGSKKRARDQSEKTEDRDDDDDDDDEDDSDGSVTSQRNARARLQRVSTPTAPKQTGKKAKLTKSSMAKHNKKKSSGGERKKSRVNFSVDEELAILNGVESYDGRISWKGILEDNKHIFQPCRTATHIQEKYKNMQKKEAQQKLAKDTGGKKWLE
jgi:hypothetical protein